MIDDLARLDGEIKQPVAPSGKRGLSVRLHMAVRHGAAEVENRQLRHRPNLRAAHHIGAVRVAVHKAHRRIVDDLVLRGLAAVRPPHGVERDMRETDRADVQVLVWVVRGPPIAGKGLIQTRPQQADHFRCRPFGPKQPFLMVAERHIARNADVAKLTPDDGQAFFEALKVSRNRRAHLLLD